MPLHLPYKQNTHMAGLIGRGILSSRTPWLHEEEARRLALPYSYTLFDFTALNLEDAALLSAVETIEGLGFRGINVTFPFKQAIIPYVDTLSDEVRKMNAINTIAFSAGKRLGYNTDYTGFAMTLAQHPQLDLAHIVLLGAGGAGSAVAYALLDAGVRSLSICDQDPHKLTALLHQLQAHYGTRAKAAEDMAATCASATGVVNATPMGMGKFPGMALPAQYLHPRLWVADIVYLPLETALLRTSKSLGCTVIDGSSMAIGQAAAAFEIFTQHKADPQPMRAAFNAFREAPTA